MGGYRLRVSEEIFDLLYATAKRLGVSPEFLVEALVEDAFRGTPRSLHVAASETSATTMQDAGDPSRIEAYA